MSKLLVRILLGLVAVITALGLFSFSVIKLLNEVRFDHYWSDMLTPPLHYLVNNKSVDLEQAPGAISLVSRSSVPLSEAYSARIIAGQVVFDDTQGEFRALLGYGADELLLFESDGAGYGVYSLYQWIVSQKLNASLALKDFDQVRHRLAEQLNISISRLQNSTRLQSQVVLDSIADNGYYISIPSKGKNEQVQSTFRLADGQIYQILFSDRFSEFSWPVVIFLVICGLVALSLSGYFLIQGFERRLRNIETVASRIARGELDARVKRAGESDAISRLGTAFNSMADHIQRLMYVQKEMIHAVSHELRTPVARIRFGVQMIEDCPGEEALKKQVAGIDGDIQELDELIDEILTYARLEQGGPILAFQESDVSAIVEQVVSEQGSVKPDIKIVSDYKKGSDRWKISEIETRYIHRSIQNLVGNATRYAESTVRVMCFFDQETCRVDVEDDGPGIPESDWESVFTPFARLDDSRTRSSGGYGLGLSIVRRILYWHGGQAFLGRSDMGGAKFSLVWPRKQPK